LKHSIPMLPTTWTAIAERPRDADGAELLTWTELPRRLLGVHEAGALAAAGTILMANRHTDTMVLLVVRSAAGPKAA
jgi:hypothetical protein